MIERPILFSPAMVRAIFAGHKWQTRRPIAIDDTPVTFEESAAGKRQRGIPPNAQNVRLVGPYLKCDAPRGSTTVSSRVQCPYGLPGDRLWVREPWHPCDAGPVLYAADYDSKEHAGVSRWFPSIHMKRVDARLELEITGIRVERIQQISLIDILNEGIDPPAVRGLDGAFAGLWDSINGGRAPWRSNPWVWVVEFRRIKP